VEVEAQGGSGGCLLSAQEDRDGVGGVGGRGDKVLAGEVIGAIG